MREKVLEYLEQIDVLDSYSYSYLINNYGEKLVNNLINMLINKDTSNLDKFDYYVKHVCTYDDVVSRDFDAYLKDISMYPVYSNVDNKKLMKDIYIIIKRIEDILCMFPSNISANSLLVDRISDLKKNNLSDDILFELDYLYEEFCKKRNEIVNGNLKFVIFVCKKYLNLYDDLNVLVQYGNIGLMHAIEKYNYNYDTAFTTYAYYWIRRYIIVNCFFCKCNFKTSYNMIFLHSEVIKAEEKLLFSLGRVPSYIDIAKYLNISVNKVRMIKDTFDEGVSLYDSIKNNDDSFIYEFIGDKCQDIENDFMKKQMVLDFREFLRGILSDNEYDVLCHRYEIDNYKFMSLVELAKKNNYSNEGIRKIEIRALKKIKDNGNDIRVYLEG